MLTANHEATVPPQDASTLQKFFNWYLIGAKEINQFMWVVRPNIQLFKVKLKLKQKYQTELYLARKNATLDNFNQKWLFNPLVLKFWIGICCEIYFLFVMPGLFRI